MKIEGEKKKRRKFHCKFMAPCSGHAGKDRACPQAPEAGFFGFLPAVLFGYPAHICSVRGITRELTLP